MPITGRYAASTWAALAGLFALGAAFYARTLGYEFVNWDDPYYVQNNPWIRGLSLEHLRAIFSESLLGGILPVHLLSYTFDHALWGLDPFGFHLHSVLLNAANGALAFWVIERITRRRDVALAAAVLFTLHPSHVEATAWISARKDLLATFFLLLSTTAYLRARRDPGLDRRAYAASLLLFALGMLAKTTIAAFPLFFLLLDAALDARRPALHRRTFAFHLASKLPYLVIAVVWAYVNARAQVVDPFTERPLVYLLLKGQAAWRYAWLLLGLIAGRPIYDLPPISLRPLLVAMTLAPLLAAPLAIALAWWRGHWNAALALGWLVAGMIPPLAFPSIAFMADRYLYTPSLGFCWLLALGIAHVAGRLKVPARRAALALLCALPALWFAAPAWRYTPVWRDSLSMWSYAAQTSRFGQGAIGLVTTLQEAGRLDEALRAADRALPEMEDSLATPELASRLNAARADVLWKLGRRTEAIADWERATAARPAQSARARGSRPRAPGAPVKRSGFEEEELVAEAIAEAGLSDLGSGHLPGLRMLLRTYAEQPYSERGRARNRRQLVRQLVTRLRVLDALRRHPEIRARAIREPWFLTGLPRSGTSALFNLLAADPSARALLNWEARIPEPLEGHPPGAPDPRRAALAASYERGRAEHNDFAAMHYTSVDTPEECVLLMGSSFHGVVSGVEVMLEPYASWYRAQPLDGLYAYYADLLRLLDWQRPGERWLLKSPAHLWGIRELLATFPDARIVWSHRDPVASIASMCSMTHLLMRAWMDVDPRTLGARVLDFYAASLERGLAARDELRPGALRRRAPRRDRERSDRSGRTHLRAASAGRSRAPRATRSCATRAPIRRASTASTTIGSRTTESRATRWRAASAAYDRAQEEADERRGGGEGRGRTRVARVLRAARARRAR